MPGSSGIKKEEDTFIDAPDIDFKRAVIPQQIVPVANNSIPSSSNKTNNIVDTNNNNNSFFKIDQNATDEELINIPESALQGNRPFFYKCSNIHIHYHVHSS